MSECKASYGPGTFQWRSWGHVHIFFITALTFSYFSYFRQKYFAKFLTEISMFSCDMPCPVPKVYISVSLYHYLVNEQSWDFPWQRCRYFSTPLWLDKIGDENCTRQIIIMRTHATQVYHIYTQQASHVLRRGSACEYITVGVLVLRKISWIPKQIINSPR